MAEAKSAHAEAIEVLRKIIKAEEEAMLSDPEE